MITNINGFIASGSPDATPTVESLQYQSDPNAPGANGMTYTNNEIAKWWTSSSSSSDGVSSGITPDTCGFECCANACGDSSPCYVDCHRTSGQAPYCFSHSDSLGSIPTEYDQKIKVIYCDDGGGP